MARSKEVLIVEDDPDIQDNLRILLEFEGYQVHSVANGAEALQYFESGHLPALVLLDLMMPIMNGWEFLTACQKDPRFAKIPVVVLSAIANKDIAYGATDFLRKPVSLDALLEKLDKLCRAQATESNTKRTLH